MEQLISFLDELKHPSVITLLLCINIGAALKRIPKFADWLIPLALAIIGAASYTFLAYKFDQDYRADIYINNIGLGALLGFGSVGIHQFIRQNKTLRDLPVLRFLVPPNGNTQIITKDDVKE